MARFNSMEKTDNYAEITASIVEALEGMLAGTINVPPWVKPWRDIGGPRNAFSNHTYRGVNTFLLAIKMSWKNWADPRFATFKQIAAKGGMVKKGEKGTKIIFWSFIKKRASDGTESTFPILRTFTVFNVAAQSEGIELPELKKNDNHENAQAAAIVKTTGADIKYGGDRACYSPAGDNINIPDINSFESSDHFYSALFHELAHWTGHSSRNNRDLKGRFGDESYAMEELIAELTSSFLCRDLGINSTINNNSLAYLASWIKVFKNDTKAIFRASSLAEAAAKYINKVEVVESEEVEE